MCEPAFRDVEVAGELSNLKRHKNGYYFSLKDAKSQLRCSMSPNAARRLAFTPADGVQVVASGAVTIFPARGELQLEVARLRPDGLGQLHAALERLRETLRAEGLFEAARKKRLPFLPRRVGVVTSLQGAVLHDIATTLARRNPAVELIVSPAPVQGEDAPERLISALRELHRVPRIDCVIVARGGGSFEDLMAFNHEKLIRCLAKCRMPVISAVGHETDTTLCDLVADHRAPTPTAAAELAAPVLEDLQRELVSLGQRARRALKRRAERERERLVQLSQTPSLRFPLRRVEAERERLADLRRRLLVALVRRVERERAQVTKLSESGALRFPLRGLEREVARLQELRMRLGAAVQALVRNRRQELGSLGGKLEALSPLAVLDRGYALCLTEDGQPITSAQQAVDGQPLDVRLRDGSLHCTVEWTTQAIPRVNPLAPEKEPV